MEVLNASLTSVLHPAAGGELGALRLVGCYRNDCEVAWTTCRWIPKPTSSLLSLSTASVGSSPCVMAPVDWSSGGSPTKPWKGTPMTAKTTGSPPAHGAEILHVVCAWCETVIQKGDLTSPMDTSHGICPPCMKTEMEEAGLWTVVPDA